MVAGIVRDRLIPEREGQQNPLAGGHRGDPLAVLGAQPLGNRTSHSGSLLLRRSGGDGLPECAPVKTAWGTDTLYDAAVAAALGAPGSALPLVLALAAGGISWLLLELAAARELPAGARGGCGSRDPSELGVRPP